MEKIDYTPAEQRVLILPEKLKEHTTSSGIILPKVEDKRPDIGVVIRVGKGSSDNPMEYNIGQRVVYSQYSGLEIRLNLVDHGINTYKVMNQIDIMGTIKGVK